jgi:membrane protein
VIGPQAAAPIKQLLDPAGNNVGAMNVAGIISILILAFSACSVFGQLQSALNIVWHVRAKPKSSILGFINKRLISLGMLFSILFMLLTSLVISSILQGIMGSHGEDETTVLMTIVNHVVSIGLSTVLFAALYKYVPDAKIAWRPTWFGAAVSAILFEIGKFLLALYLGRGSYENSYGAAVGSFVALLVWVYYSSTIVLVGAEITEVWARRYGHRLEPSEHAVRVVQQEQEIK